MDKNYTEIDFQKSQEIFELAEINNLRLRMGDFDTAQWLQKKNINLDIVKDFTQQYHDMRIFIIGEGEHEGFYIYSKKQETCIKFEASNIQKK